MTDAATDKSPRATEQGDLPQRAEVSNYEIVSHYFGRAAERLELREDIAAVLRSSYVDPKQLDVAEQQVVARSFMDKIEKVLGPMRDIPAPDVGTNAQTMAWLMDEYGKLHGHTPACVTGKPIALEGSYGREAARIMQQLGAKLVGVSDADGAIRSEAGIDADKLAGIVADGGVVTDYDGADQLPPDELIGIECDVFIPAALGGMIHKQNADRVKARMIVEGANSPTTPAADDLLADRGVLVVPDVMANAGGVVVSYFEWVQNLQHFRWDEREVNERLGRLMRKAFREVSARAEESGESMRVAAYELGIERVVEAASTRGYI